MPTAPDVRAAAPPRDRLVLLGRSGSGKTTYLARLYHQLSEGVGDLHMIALNGPAHVACMETIDEMVTGQWPAATLSSWFLELEITRAGRKRKFFALDYPGHVFHRAFVDNEQCSETEELMAHIDRAALVIVLIDPAVAEFGTRSEVVDDDYGMGRALARLRATPGGAAVPVAIVFTKCDEHRDLIRSQGGLKKYLADHYRNLLRQVGRFRIFGCAAVMTEVDASGQRQPSMEAPPAGIIEPLTYCLDPHPAAEAAVAPAAGSATAPSSAARRSSASAEAEPAERRSRSAGFWALVWSLGAVSVIVLAVATWLFAFGLPHWMITQEAQAPVASTPPPPPHAISAQEAVETYELVQETVCRVVIRLHYEYKRNRVAKIPSGVGSGFVVSNEGLIVTNRHVVDPGYLDENWDDMPGIVGWDVIVLFHRDDVTTELVANDIEWSERYDLAWFTVDQRFSRSLRFAPTPVPGEAARAYGFPANADTWTPLDDLADASRRQRELLKTLGTSREPSAVEWIGGPANLIPTATAGIVSAMRETVEGLLIQTDTYVSPGNSGGPLLDRSGQVMGVVTFGSADSGKVNFCIASEAVWHELGDAPGVRWPQGW